MRVESNRSLGLQMLHIIKGGGSHVHSICGPNCTHHRSCQRRHGHRRCSSLFCYCAVVPGRMT